MNPNKLSEIFESDDSGILDIPDKPIVISSDDRLLASFEEINDFVKENNRQPEVSGEDMHEFQLYKRLQSIIANNNKVSFLKEYDEFNLLVPATASASIDDLILDDSLGLLDDSESYDIFNIRNIPTNISKSDFIANRKKCDDFELFEKLFIKCHQGIEDKTLKLEPFSHQHQIKKGRFFVNQGLVLYIAEVKKPKDVFGRMKSRLRCIYENGTESNVFLRSLSSQLYKGGKIISGVEDLNIFESINDDDISTGYIYVLKSLSKDINIKKIDNLFKIGFSSNPVKERIRNAKSDPTYFMSPVDIVATYECFNLNPQKFENLLHKFFSSSRLNTEITNLKGYQHSANEWFVIPFEIIDQAIKLIINGEVIDYYYDDFNQDIKLKEV